MAHKLIKDLDEELWRKFVAYCTLKGVRVNKEIEELLKKHLYKNFNKLLKSRKKK